MEVPLSGASRFRYGGLCDWVYPVRKVSTKINLSDVKVLPNQICRVWGDVVQCGGSSRGDARGHRGLGSVDPPRSPFCQYRLRVCVFPKVVPTRLLPCPSLVSVDGVVVGALLLRAAGAGSVL